MTSKLAKNRPESLDFSNWTTPQPATLPRPTYWPVVMAAGIVLMMGAILTSWAVAVLGALLFIISLAGWIRDLLDEAADEA